MGAEWLLDLLNTRVTALDSKSTDRKMRLPTALRKISVSGYATIRKQNFKHHPREIPANKNNLTPAQ
jgi:hypothetical protein